MESFFVTGLEGEGKWSFELVHPPSVLGPLSITLSVGLILLGRCRTSGNSVESPPSSLGRNARSSGSGDSNERSRRFRE